MFYSHEILTSRRSGLATVWLAATISSTPGLKKLNRKAIFEVNIPKTCEIVIHPEAPMALRLQSNLLYGISRIYSQQGTYVLSDAQLAQANMRALLKAVRTSELDPKAGKARPEQLILEDDPAFFADLVLPDIDLDLSVLDFSTDRSPHPSSILSAHSHRSSQTSGEGSVQGLILPSSGSGGAGGFQLPSEHGSSVQRNERLARLLDDDGDAFNIDPGFSIDAEGNVVEEPFGGSVIETGPVRARSDAAARGQVRSQRGDFQPQDQAGATPMDMDFDMPLFDDQQIILPDAEPFPSMRPVDPAIPGQGTSSAQPQEEEEYSETAEAPIRQRRKKARPLALDQRMELRNADLASWKDDYLTNMIEATRARLQHRAVSLAKKNAAQWITGIGIGGVGAAIGTSNLPGPLHIFAGDPLMDMLLGPISDRGGRKRRLSEVSEADVSSETQRRRMREGDAEIGLGDDGNFFQNDDLGLHSSEAPEIGRHAPTPLADDPSFPWNTTASALASRHGSSIAHSHVPSNIGGFPSSAGGTAPPTTLPLRQGSHIPTASPLIGRGSHRFSSLKLPSDDGNGELDLGAGGFPSDDAIGGMGAEYDDFELHGPAAGVGTQTQMQSQWLRDTLDREAANFLEFVREATTTGKGEDDDDELTAEEPGEGQGSIDFEKLLPPDQHSTVVAAQAFHHVLALATMGNLDVQQAAPFGPIKMKVAEVTNLGSEQAMEFEIEA
ncbi:uncharacterized protein KY384_006384 [Bacidia gigantensis]|uniref:uncharacterized protein n=1 Tax=Bacidia gigantensis TaxID=2732470 RepID=UPI001D048F79|nr:uncharacterized protein KY384_006384 [Bacidia gigantensis]KAG8528697.1 hypothetical protein KY384_006384 [Bacidia gigantensis]